MPKFRRRETVMAEQWSPETPVEGVQYPLPNDPHNPPRCGRIQLFKNGAHHLIEPGEWVITNSQHKSICAPWIFERNYIEVS
jgi:hypothetical protein